jgi:hypothetical protein
MNISDYSEDWPIVAHLSEHLLMPFGKHEGKSIGEVPIAYLDGQVSRWDRNILQRQIEFVLDFLWKELAAHGHTLLPDTQCTFRDALAHLKELSVERNDHEVRQRIEALLAQEP